MDPRVKEEIRRIEEEGGPIKDTLDKLDEKDLENLSKLFEAVKKIRPKKGE